MNVFEDQSGPSGSLHLELQKLGLDGGLFNLQHGTEEDEVDEVDMERHTALRRMLADIPEEDSMLSPDEDEDTDLSHYHDNTQNNGLLTDGQSMTASGVNDSNGSNFSYPEYTMADHGRGKEVEESSEIETGGDSWTESGVAGSMYDQIQQQVDMVNMTEYEGKLEIRDRDNYGDGYSLGTSNDSVSQFEVVSTAIQGHIPNTFQKENLYMPQREVRDTHMDYLNQSRQLEPARDVEEDMENSITDYRDRHLLSSIDSEFKEENEGEEGNRVEQEIEGDSDLAGSVSYDWLDKNISRDSVDMGPSGAGYSHNDSITDGENNSGSMFTRHGSAIIMESEQTVPMKIGKDTSHLPIIPNRDMPSIGRSADIPFFTQSREFSAANQNLPPARPEKLGTNQPTFKDDFKEKDPHYNEKNTIIDTSQLVSLQQDRQQIYGNGKENIVNIDQPGVDGSEYRSFEMIDAVDETYEQNLNLQISGVTDDLSFSDLDGTGVGMHNLGSISNYSGSDISLNLSIDVVEENENIGTENNDMWLEPAKKIGTGPGKHRITQDLREREVVEEEDKREQHTEKYREEEVQHRDIGMRESTGMNQSEVIPESQAQITQVFFNQLLQGTSQHSPNHNSSPIHPVNAASQTNVRKSTNQDRRKTDVIPEFNFHKASSGIPEVISPNMKGEKAHHDYIALAEAGPKSAPLLRRASNKSHIQSKEYPKDKPGFLKPLLLETEEEIHVDQKTPSQEIAPKKGGIDRLDRGYSEELPEGKTDEDNVKYSNGALLDSKKNGKWGEFDGLDLAGIGLGGRNTGRASLPPMATTTSPGSVPYQARISLPDNLEPENDGAYKSLQETFNVRYEEKRNRQTALSGDSLAKQPLVIDKDTYVVTPYHRASKPRTGWYNGEESSSDDSMTADQSTKKPTQGEANKHNSIAADSDFDSEEIEEEIMKTPKFKGTRSIETFVTPPSLKLRDKSRDASPRTNDIKPSSKGYVTPPSSGPNKDTYISSVQDESNAKATRKTSIEDQSLCTSLFGSPKGSPMGQGYDVKQLQKKVKQMQHEKEEKDRAYEDTMAALRSRLEDQHASEPSQRAVRYEQELRAIRQQYDRQSTDVRAQLQAAQSLLKRDRHIWEKKEAEILAHVAELQNQVNQLREEKTVAVGKLMAEIENQQKQVLDLIDKTKAQEDATSALVALRKQTVSTNRAKTMLESMCESLQVELDDARAQCQMNAVAARLETYPGGEMDTLNDCEGLLTGPLERSKLGDMKRELLKAVACNHAKLISITELKDKIKQLRNEQEAERISVDETVSALQQKCAVATSTAQQLKEINQRLIQERDEAIGLAGENLPMKRRLTSTEEENVRLHKEVAELRIACDTHVTDAAKANRSLNEMKETLAQRESYYQRQAAKATADILRLENEITSKTSSFQAELLQQIDAHKIELDHVKDQRDEVKQQYLELCNETRSSQGNHSALLARSTQSNPEIPTYQMTGLKNGEKGNAMNVNEEIEKAKTMVELMWQRKWMAREEELREELRKEKEKEKEDVQQIGSSQNAHQCCACVDRHLRLIKNERATNQKLRKELEKSTVVVTATDNNANMKAAHDAYLRSLRRIKDEVARVRNADMEAMIRHMDKERKRMGKQVRAYHRECIKYTERVHRYQNHPHLLPTPPLLLQLTSERAPNIPMVPILVADPGPQTPANDREIQDTKEDGAKGVTTAYIEDSFRSVDAVAAISVSMLMRDNNSFFSS